MLETQRVGASMLAQKEKKISIYLCSSVVTIFNNSLLCKEGYREI